MRSYLVAKAPTTETSLRTLHLKNIIVSLVSLSGLIYFLLVKYLSFLLPFVSGTDGISKGMSDESAPLITVEKCHLLHGILNRASL